MKKILLSILLFQFVVLLNAQTGNVGIGTTTPDPSAKLDITSTDRGLLIPRVSLSNTGTWGLAGATPINGMLVYNTNAAIAGSGAGNVGFYLWNGSWGKVVTGTIATLTNGKVWIGNASNVPTEQTMSGDGTISNAGVLDLNNLAVETSEIADAAVTTIKIADANVTTAKILDANVTTAKIADANVTTAKIADNAVTGTKIDISGNLIGDIMYYNGTDWVRLASGTTGQMLQTTSGAAPSWVNGTKNTKAQNGVNVQTAAPNATATDPYIELGGALVRPTTVSGLTATNKMSFTGTGVDAFNVDGTTLSIDATNDRVGIGTISPANKLHVFGNSSKIIIDNGVNATSEIGIEFRNGDASASQPKSAIISKGYNTWKRANMHFVLDGAADDGPYDLAADTKMIIMAESGNVGIATTAPGQKLTIAGTGDVLGVDNQASFVAKNSAGTYENFFWPRWSDNVMYMNFGSGGLNLRNNSSATAMFIDPDLSIDIRRGVLFNCNDCGSASTIDGTADWGDLVIQGRVISTNSNLHLSPPGGSKVIINSGYRSAGGSAGTTGLEIQDGGIRMNKTYRHYQNYMYCNCYGAGAWGPNSLGAWDFCALSQVGFKNNYSATDEDDDVQCAVYPSNSGYGETSVYDVTYSHAYNSRPTWYMYMEAYEDTRGVTCAANCINFE